MVAAVSEATQLHPGRHGLVVVVDAAEELSAQLAALHPAERALAAEMKPLRQREWVAGRTALREALRHAALVEPGLRDAEHAPLLKDDRGAPLLPAAALGSISHKGARAAALVAPHRAGCSLGLDLELVRGPRVDISQRVLTARELDELARYQGEARATALALRFSIKEAVYKAIDPRVRRYVGFREVELTLEPDDPDALASGHASSSGTGRAVAVAPELIHELGACALEITWTRLGDHWLSTARAQH
jgi:phosphopantetheine--protein transferase-like protein